MAASIALVKGRIQVRIACPDLEYGEEDVVLSNSENDDFNFEDNDELDWEEVIPLGYTQSSAQ